ncbi:MAG: hypothetical protein ACYCY9_13235 [Thiobacillus sp.]
MRQLACALLLLLSTHPAAANQEGELQRLHAALNMLNQEQLAIYQQFQMVQALRRSNFQAPYSAMLLPVPSGKIANYDDVIAAQNEAIRRNEALSEKASQLVTRYDEIEEAKKPLQQQILRLMDGNR